jgi:hypothetical protein
VLFTGKTRYWSTFTLIWLVASAVWLGLVLLFSWMGSHAINQMRTEKTRPGEAGEAKALERGWPADLPWRMRRLLDDPVGTQRAAKR